MLPGPEYSREILTPEKLPEPIGFAYGLKTLGGRRVEIAGAPDSSTAANFSADMPTQMDLALGSMLAGLAARGGRPHDIVSFTMVTSDVAQYRDRETRRALRDVWQKYFGDQYFPTKLVEQNFQIPLITLSGTALVAAPVSFRTGAMIWLGGQNGFNSEGLIEGNIVRQTELIMMGLEAVLREGGTSLETARTIRLRMFADPDVLAAHQSDVFARVSNAIGGRDLKHTLTVDIATGFFEPEAAIEIDGCVELE